MLSKKMKLGLLVDTYDLPAWEYKALEDIVKSNVAEFTLLVLNGSKLEQNHEKEGNSSLYFLFNRIDEKLFEKEPSPFLTKNILDLLPDIPEIKIFPEKENNYYVLIKSDADAIKDYQLDVLIKFGFHSLACESLHVSKFGTWFYTYSDNLSSSITPPGFWEVVENWPETSSALLSIGGESAFNQILYRSYFFTYHLSPARHRSLYFWAMSSFLPRQLSLLHRLGEADFRNQIERFRILPNTEIKSYGNPSTFQVIKAMLTIGSRLIGEILKRVFYFDQWFLLISFKTEVFLDFASFKALRPPKDKFWADPHIVQTNDNYYIFIEEFCRSNNKGHISVIELDENGNYKKPVKILEKNYHLSYPFVFERDGTYYMVPESGENKSIDIYECVKFPYQWKFKQTLMDNVKAVDTNLLHHGGKWWLFTGIAENEAAAPHVELFLFYADDLFSREWKAHPLNPVVSDVKRARAGGRIFIVDGILFRPSQDCSIRYGYGFDLNEIVLLSETEYCEKTVKSIRPDPGNKILATHTYANQGSLTVIDALVRQPNWKSQHDCS